MFQNPIGLSDKRIRIADEDGSSNDTIRVWVTYINDKGYEELDMKPIDCSSASYQIIHDKETSFYITADTGGRERRYSLTIE